MYEADMTIKEANVPITRWCDSGHNAQATFRRQGPDKPAEPIRFFTVTGHGINGTFCEPCLIVANHIAQQKKLGNI
jgi:hypothetical protein